MSDLKQSPTEDLETFEEPAGTSYESMLITTDSFEEMTQELSASLEDETSLANRLKAKASIQEIQQTIETTETVRSPPPQTSAIKSKINNGQSPSDEMLNDKTATELVALSETGSESDQDQEGFYSGESNGSNNTEDYLHDSEWLNKREHVFVLSSAGKPIYSLHGNEDKLATLCGVMQALVSVVHANQDSIMSIHAVGIKFVFLVKGPLILVAASRRNLSVQQIQLQLTLVFFFLRSCFTLKTITNKVFLFRDVYNQILSILTLSHMTKIFDQRKNFDLRRLLAGSERLIDHLLTNDSSKRANNKSKCRHQAYFDRQKIYI